MSGYHTPTPVPGDEDLPELIFRVPGRQTHSYPETADTLPHDLLPPQTSRFETTPYEPTYSAMDKAFCTMHDTVPASAILHPHHEHGPDHGYDTTAQQNDTTATSWLASQNSACCASCPKWSLARSSAAAAALLDAFNEHDSHSYSDSDRRRAARLLQQHLMDPHNLYSYSYFSPEDNTPPHSSHQHPHRTKSKHANLAPPMLRRWFRQPPRQECFSGIAAAAAHAARASTVGTIQSRL